MKGFAKRGFTLIELLVTIAIMATIATVAVIYTSRPHLAEDVKSTAQQMAALLRQAQSDSMAGAQGAAWGVYFSNATSTSPFFALFMNSYSTSTVRGTYPLPATVGYGASFLPAGGTLSIIFSPITGAASASTTIQLYALGQPALSSTVNVAATGAVSQ